jgi:hypothetical protein
MIKENGFTTRITDIDFYTYKQNIFKHNYDIEGEAIIHWEFYVEYRSWGIKTISCYATRVEVDYTLTHWDKNGKDDRIDEFTIDTSLSAFEDWEVQNENDDIEFGDSICPQNIEVNFEDKTITINF